MRFTMLRQYDAESKVWTYQIIDQLRHRTVNLAITSKPTAPKWLQQLQSKLNSNQQVKDNPKCI